MVLNIISIDEWQNGVECLNRINEILSHYLQNPDSNIQVNDPDGQPYSYIGKFKNTIKEIKLDFGDIPLFADFRTIYMIPE